MGRKRRVRLKGAAGAEVSVDVRAKKTELIIELPERARRSLLRLLQGPKLKKKKR
jgi:hypothetical protein